MSVREWCLLAVLLVAAPLIYLPVLTHNLPVAANTDERGALEVLQRFHQGSLNPDFFQYPTLYFYLVYALVLPFQYSSVNVMLAGRLLDFELMAVIAFIAYAFCRDYFETRSGGLIAAGCVLGSAALSEVAGYLHPDILMTVFGMVALYYLVEYFEHRTQRSWMVGLCFVGLSTGCKYTAFLLYAAYAATEMLESVRERRAESLRGSGERLSRGLCCLTLLLVGVVLLLSAVFFPERRLLDLIAHTRSNFEVRSANYYSEFFSHLRHSLRLAGFAAFAVAAACRISRYVYGAISIKRLYYGLGIVLLVSMMCSPFGIVHPEKFLFELGALARSNIVVLDGHAQWRDYVWLSMHLEGSVAVLLGVVGLVSCLREKKNRRLSVVAIYLALYLYVIGSSQRGFFRYLAPVVPLVYCGTGAAIVWLWKYSREAGPAKDGQWPHRVLAASLVAAMAMQMGLSIARSRREARGNNSYLTSFEVAKNATRGTAYYAGYAPSVELQEAGIRTRQLAWPAIDKGPLAQSIACGDVLILNTTQAATYGIDALHDASVDILFDDPIEGRQQVVRKSGCP
jgi:hypothetical protein